MGIRPVLVRLLAGGGLRISRQLVIVQGLRKHSRPLTHLDFGSGVGVTSQLFTAMGYETTLADVSTPLLDFAKFRLGRRGVEAQYMDLSTSRPLGGGFDVVTAIDTLAHVPDVAETSAALHEAMAPRGELWANFDTRPKTRENAWHLYDDDLPLRWKLQRAGFEPARAYDGMITRYGRVEVGTTAHMLHGARDLLLLRGPARPAYRRLRHGALPFAAAGLQETRTRLAKRGRSQDVAAGVER